MASTVEQRVENDMRAGRLWKARDRLIGVLRAAPTLQERLKAEGRFSEQRDHESPPAWTGN
jgi:hypothetical protein